MITQWDSPLLNRIGLTYDPATGTGRLPGGTTLRDAPASSLNPLRIFNRAFPTVRTAIGVGVGVATAGVAGGALQIGARHFSGVGMGALNPGTTPAPVLPGMGEYGPTTPSFCNLITNTALRAACLAGTSILGGGGGGGGNIVPPNNCPPGYRPNGSGGCQLEGMAPYIPGDVGRPDVIWNAVNGRYGAGVSPVAVQSQRMFCPAGYKLGKDNVCYECLPKTARKWNPGTKPLFTGGDMNALRRAKRLQKKARGIQKLFPSAKACRPTKGKRK